MLHARAYVHHYEKWGLAASTLDGAIDLAEDLAMAYEGL